MNTKEKVTLEDGRIIERQRTEVWGRVMGYCRPVSHYNEGKKAEFYGRKNFSYEATSNSKFTSQFN